MPSAECTWISAKRANIVHGGDAARSRDLVPGRRAQPPEPIQIGALHHSFLIDVGAEEAGAIGLQSLDHLLGRELGCLAPSLDHDASVLGIERDDQALRPAAAAISSSDGVNAAVPTITRCAP